MRRAEQTEHPFKGNNADRLLCRDRLAVQLLRRTVLHVRLSRTGPRSKASPHSKTDLLNRVNLHSKTGRLSRISRHNLTDLRSKTVLRRNVEVGRRAERINRVLHKEKELR